MKKYVMKLRFDFGVNSLYEIGYLLIDIYHLVVFSELLEQQNFKTLDDLFFEPRRGYVLTRNNEILTEFRNSAKVEHIRDGCVEIVIGGLGVVASTIIPFVVAKVQDNARRREERITFEIDADDQELRNLIEGVGQGYYGFEEDGTRWLLKTLANRGYNIEVQNQDVYKITKVLNNISKRMVKVIPKHID